jgi:hypothetical protein
MKKSYTVLSILLLFLVLPSYSQDPGQENIRYPGKDQSKLPNDVNVSYGLGTAYLFMNEVDHDYGLPTSYATSEQSDINSPGSLMLGYNRLMSKGFMVGFLASWVNTKYTRTYLDTSKVQVGTASFNDNLLSGLAKVTFNYVNKPRVRVYSAAGIGITVDLSNVEGNMPQSVSQTARKILFAGQVIFMGIRFGRTFGGFCEFGFGTNAIISAGLNYQFSD